MKLDIMGKSKNKFPVIMRLKISDRCVDVSDCLNFAYKNIFIGKSEISCYFTMMMKKYFKSATW